MAIEDDDFDINWFKSIDLEIDNLVEKFNLESNLLKIYTLNQSSLDGEFKSDVEEDLDLIEVAVGLIALYCLLFLGSCSPIHCRFFLALVGLSTVLISYVTGFALCFLMDQKTAGVH